MADDRDQADEPNPHSPEHDDTRREQARIERMRWVRLLSVKYYPPPKGRPKRSGVRRVF